MFALRFSLKTRDLRRGLAALTLVFTAGCEGGSSGPDEPEILYEDFAAAVEEAECEWRTKCNLEESVEACRETTFLDRSDTYVSAAVEAGTIRYEGAAAYRCVEEIVARGCERAEPLAPSCAEVFAGQVGPEDPCLISDECVEDGVCGFDPTCLEECCAGACRLLPGPAEIGDSCINQNVECVEGAYCALDPMTFQRTVCAAKAPLGAACDNGIVECDDKIGFCNFNNGVCEELRADGELCLGNGSCVEGSYCEWVGEDYAEQRCRPTLGVALLGETCLPELGQWGCAEHGVICSLGAVCVLAPGPNEPCIDYSCAAYAKCGDANLCIKEALLGERCGYLDESYSDPISCAGELVCDGEVEFMRKCTEPEFAADICEVPGMPFSSSSSGG